MKAFRLMFISLAVTVLLAVSAAAQGKVDIFGYYSIEHSPRAFRDISEINLAGNYGANEQPPTYGLIRLKRKSAKDYRLMKPNLDGKNLTFKTKTVAGVHYEFAGAFTRLEDFPTTQPNGQVLLKGRLSKYRGKRRIASSYLNFSYEAGD
ncbi:MAG: hypothetical protein ACJ73D_09795 [Pyrinomonadaceae bacterium]